MKDNKARPTIAFLLSTSIHILLFAGIVYTGLDMALPEGTVTSTEIEIIDAPIPQGNQNKDSSMANTSVAKVVKPKTNKKAPPPPPPPPAKKSNDSAIDEGDIALAKEKKKEAKPLRELVKKEKEPLSDPLDKYFDEQNLEDIESETVAENSDEEEAFNDLEQEEDLDFPESEEERDGNAYNDELAYGSSAGVRSDKELSPVPGNVQPEYPMVARLRRQEGSVVLQFDVLSNGSVSNVELVQSSGYERLDNSAIDAHKKWRYRPGKTGKFMKTYRFSLRGEAVEAPGRLRRDSN